MPEPKALQRYEKLQKLWIVLAGLVVFFLIASAIGAKLYANAQVDRRNEIRVEFCLLLEDVRAYVRGSATRSIKALPGVDYYKTHPEELRAAIENLKEQRDAFSPPLDCDSFAE